MFIGENLENIRLLNGLSRKELAEKIEISEQAVWQYEVKNMMPEINKIYEMSKEFNVKSAYFITERPKILKENSIDRHSVAFRTKNQNTSIKSLSKQSAQANCLSNLTNYLFKFIKKPSMSIFKVINEIEKIQNEPTTDGFNEKDYIKQVAKVARKMLIDNDNNNKLLFNLEKAGIVLYEKNINQDTDAFSFWSHQEIPYIILGNNKGVAVRRNFDIAHELGHIILHRHIQFDVLSNKEYKMIEKEADIFASEFLLPQDEFIADFNQLNKKSNPDQFKMLKEKWHVSIQAMGMRAYYLDLLSDTQYRYFWSLVHKKGYKKMEPLDDEISISRPVKMNSLLNLFFEKKIIKPETLLDELKVEPEFLYDLGSLSPRIFNKYMNNNDEEQEYMNNFVELYSNR